MLESRTGRVANAEQMSEAVPEGLALVSPGIYYTDGGFAAVDRSIIAFLKARALEAPHCRARVCLHADPADAQHDMLIVMHRSSYVAPHCHFNKSESLVLVEGACDAILFEPDGRVSRVVPMNANARDGCLLYRMPARLYHTLRLRSEWTVFIESTVGPFDRRDTGVAAWAPAETEPDVGHAYLSELTAGQVPAY